MEKIKEPKANIVVIALRKIAFPVLAKISFLFKNIFKEKKDFFK